MSLKKKATKGIFWSFAQQFGSLFISFFVSTLLARMLLPEEFGLIGMLAIFMGIGNTLISAGLTTSLIRGHNLDQEDFSTVFFFNLVGSVLVYALIFIAAPFIADFYKQPMLTSITRVYCLTFIISAFSAIQLTRLTKEMDFKTQTLTALPSLIASSLISISLAYWGWGVWSLVWGAIASSLFTSILLWFYSGWKPSFVFNVAKFKYHFNFGYKLMLTGLLDTFCTNIYTIIIGRFFSPAQVGFYTRADSFKQLPVNAISGVLSKVTLPLFASIHDDDIRLKDVYKKLMKMVIFIVAPILISMSVLAEPMFRFLFTEKWLPAVLYFRILCFAGILYPIHSYNLSILNVKGRSDLFLKLEIIKKLSLAIIVVISLKGGILYLLWGSVLFSIYALFINMHYTGKLINYNALEQFKDLLPSLVCSAVVGIGVYAILDSVPQQSDFITLLGGGTMYWMLYLVINFIIKSSSLLEIKEIIINFKNHVSK